MGKSSRAVLLGLIVGVSAPIGLVFAQSQSNQPELTRLSGVTTSTITVPVELNRAWEVLTGYESTAIQMPDIKKVKIIFRNGHSLRLSQTYQAPYTFGLEISALIHVKETPKKMIEYKLLKGDLIRSLRGKWKLKPIDGGTMVSHSIDIDPEIPEVFKPVFRELSETNLNQSMKILYELMVSPAISQPL
ncbi:SRPBCC family protein [Prochlorococcus sp. MIT 1341]|uniref:SRPBCC family protein n=1 Tax=Prochlorococcus sp. MIT 1341 TaxID=3096221 RepID=UPI002A762AAE|nr:SRPBCC family protein [Prochlorococcus sp. MIT 1341]